MSKKAQIQEMSAEGMSAAEIAEELDTSKSYVYKCRSGGNSNTEGGAAEPSGTTQTETAEPEPEPEETGTSVDNSGAEDLETNDSGAKTYECGECDRSLDYLQKQCECGAKPAWSVIG